jgi:hypothetical protein
MLAGRGEPRLVTACCSHSLDPWLLQLLADLLSICGLFFRLAEREIIIAP